MIKLSNGVEISEDTVVSALKKAGIKVEPRESSVLLYGKIEGHQDDVYLEFNQVGSTVKVESVTKDGKWRKNICLFTAKGLMLNESADNAGFPVEGRDNTIKLCGTY